jgi:hypothetical protein
VTVEQQVNRVHAQQSVAANARRVRRRSHPFLTRLLTLGIWVAARSTDT